MATLAAKRGTTGIAPSDHEVCCTAMRMAGQLEARLCLAETAIIVLLGALNDTSPVRAELSRLVVAKFGAEILEHLPFELGPQAEARVAQSINSFLSVLPQPVAAL